MNSISKTSECTCESTEESSEKNRIRAKNNQHSHKGVIPITSPAPICVKMYFTPANAAVYTDGRNKNKGSESRHEAKYAIF